MPNTTIASASFSSRREANQAIRRLVSAGFARNSIDMLNHDDDDGVDLEVHTRSSNLHKVQRLIGGGGAMGSVRQVGYSAVSAVRSHPLILLGAGLLAGFAIYQLIPRSNDTSSHRSQGHQGGGQRRRH